MDAFWIGKFEQISTQNHCSHCNIVVKNMDDSDAHNASSIENIYHCLQNVAIHPNIIYLAYYLLYIFIIIYSLIFFSVKTRLNDVKFSRDSPNITLVIIHNLYVRFDEYRIFYTCGNMNYYKRKENLKVLEAITLGSLPTPCSQLKSVQPCCGAAEKTGIIVLTLYSAARN